MHVIYVTSLFCREDNRDGDVHFEPNVVQQVNLELSRKKMAISKNCIQLSKVVGQGRVSH